MKITPEIELRINKLYYELGTYSGVAKIIGCAPSTVKNHIIKDFTPEPEVEPIRFTKAEIPKQLNDEISLSTDNYGELCVLSEEEKEELKELWKELAL